MIHSGLLNQVKHTTVNAQTHTIRLAEVLELDCAEYLEWVNHQAANPLIRIEYTNKGSEYAQYASDEPQCLHDHIEAQTISWSSVDRRIAHHILNGLDAAGYLRCSTNSIAADVGCAPDLVENALRKFQQLDPLGIGARSFVECLEVQVRADPNLQQKANAIVLELEHLQDLDCGTTEFIDICNRLSRDISHLNPRPGSRFEIRRPQILRHDIEYIDSKVNVVDYALLKIDCNAQRHVPSVLQQARQAIHLAEQRRDVLYRITSVMCEVQQDFLNGHSDQLRVLTARDIARETQVHESMVSRVLRNKVVDAPIGGIQAQKLLSKRSSFGVSVSTVKKHVVRLSASGLADHDVSLALRDLGICISRRTVCKYRGQARD
jgi:RNA polymerase sigma-54 factor